MIIQHTDDPMLSMHTHIIDKKTGEDLTKKHPFRWWDTIKKKGEYILQDIDGKPVWYPNPKIADGGEFETIRAKFRNAKTEIRCKSVDARMLLERLYPEIKTNKDLELVAE